MEHSSLNRVIAAVFVLLTWALPVSSQNPAYFSLTSSGTYRLGERPQIQLYATNVRSLEFRVYRVNDPIEFFRSLEDLHNFGGRAPKLPRDLTPIERFHRFKRQLRLRGQNFFRSQYTHQSRAVIREWMEARNRPPAQKPLQNVMPGVETYPAVPLLNPQQVVATWRQTVSVIQRWDQRSIPVDVPGKGLFLVEATNGDLRAYTLLMITDLAVVTKSDSRNLLAFVVNRNSGAPVADCDLWVMGNHQELSRTKTDANGVFGMQLGLKTSEQIVVLAKNGDDFAASGSYGWGLNDSDRSMVGYIYSDRPVYRPGHVVHFKGILRRQTPDDYALLSRKEVDVDIDDPEGKSVFRKTLAVSSNGTINSDFTIPASAALGYYTIAVRAGETIASGGFHVDEYKKPEYEVKVIPDKPRVLQSEKIAARVEARYYFGEPVAHGKVKYVVHTAPFWFFPRDDEFGGEFERESGGEEYDYAGSQIEEQTGQLDADGKLTIEIPTNVSPLRNDVRYRIEARVTDESNREIAGHASVPATYGSFVVRVRSEKYFHESGSTGQFAVEARDYDNKPIETDIQLDLLRSRWQAPRTGERVPMFSSKARTDANGEAKVEIPLRDAGSFEVRVTAHTPEDRDVTDSGYIWVSGSTPDWFSEQRERIQIVPDKPSYQIGDTAKIFIVTGVPEAYVLVTTEGKGLKTHEVVHVTNPTLNIDVPIRREFAPNFFLNAVFLRNDQYYEGTKSIRVPPVENELSVDVQSSKSEYKPGEPAVFSVTTRDQKGSPVSAEVSLGIVDEAIYAVKPEGTPDIVKFFYGTQYNRVATSTSLRYYFSGAAGKRQMRLTEVRPATALGQLKPEKLGEPRVRKAFPDTALWVANLTTDSNGRAEARLEFPDALTTWRATARAATTDTRVGNTTQRTIVRKNLMIRLAVPRFFRQGDEVTISAIVHNYLTSDKIARVNVQVEGLQVLEGTERSVPVPTRGDVNVDWKVRAGEKLEAKILAKALTDEESDAMELTLPIVPHGVKLSEARAGSLTRSPVVETTITFPRNVVPTSRVLDITVTPSLAGAIFGALDYLTSFPYGCTEQTMSSFLPNVIVTKALSDLKVKSNVDEGALAQKTREGLNRLYDFQHPDGGWGWWQTDDSGAFMTAYVISGLVQARDAGINVRQDVITRGVNWLNQEFDRSAAVVPDLRAYLLYTVTQGGSVAANKVASIWNDRSRLTPYGLALLGLTLDKLGDSRTNEIAAMLESSAKSDDFEAYWATDRDNLMEYEIDSSAESTAHALKFLSRARPQSPLLQKIVLWLVNHRNEGYYWYSTKQTAMVVNGLTDYLKASGELHPDFMVTVWVNDRQVFTRAFTPADAMTVSPPTIHLTSDQLADGANQIKIRKSGDGMLYWSARGDYFSTEDRLVRTGSMALNVIREYFELTPETENGRIVYRLDPSDGSVKPGDVVVVRLTVSGGSWRYLLVEDPIPAGTEFIQRDDLYELKQRPPWWSSYYTRREFHDDRAAFFQTYFDRGQTQYVYMLKVVNPGQFRVSPAKVQPMYQPQYLSTTENQMVVVKP